jgi:hypothetical protein
VEPSSLSLRPYIGLFYQSYMIDSDDYGAISAANAWKEKSV